MAIYAVLSGVSGSPTVGQAQAPVVSVPGPPEDVTSAKAYAVLDQHCARCHQRGRTGDRPPMARLDNILALDALSKSAHVVPRVPDASPLLIAVQTRMAPHDFRSDQEGAPLALTSTDLMALRDWVSGVPRPIRTAPREAMVAPITVVAPIEMPIEPSATPSIAAVVSTPPLQLTLALSRSTAVRGDAVTVRATPSATCHLTIISVDTKGRATVIFPSDFDTNNRIEQGKNLRVPADGAGYTFRLSQSGRQTFVGLCSASQKVPPGIVHDFERQRFTELGDYRAFVARAWDAAIYGGDRAENRANDTPRRNRRDRAERTSTPAPAPPAVPGSEARTAVEIEVE